MSGDMCADPYFLNAFEPWYLDAYQRKPLSEAGVNVRRLMTFALVPAVLGFTCYEIIKTGFRGERSKVIPASAMYTREGEGDSVQDEDVTALWRQVSECGAMDTCYSRRCSNIRSCVV